MGQDELLKFPPFWETISWNLFRLMEIFRESVEDLMRSPRRMFIRISMAFESRKTQGNVEIVNKIVNKTQF